MSHYCKLAARRAHPDGCMMQCGECGAWEALQLQAEHEAKQSAVSQQWSRSRSTEPYIAVSGTNLEPELNALMRDAKRYRWIREHWGVSYHVEDSDMRGEKLDAAVDDAIDEALLPKSQRWP